MTVIKIKKRVTREVLFRTTTATDLKGCLHQARALGVNLIGAELFNSNLVGIDLAGVDLSDSNLRGANLSHASLENVKLCGADLPGADLSSARLVGADLRYTNLRNAKLANALLAGADLAAADLTGVMITPEQLGQLGIHIPRVELLDQKMLSAITTEGGKLDMADWHMSGKTQATCGSTHCRAGWAVHLAGEAGYALEDKVGPSTAGALIYLKSTGRHVPDFVASNEAARADIQRWASE